MPPRIQDREAAFWANVDRSGGDDACWPWMRARDDRDYGKLGWSEGGEHKDARAHQVAFFYANGRPPADGHLIRHSCDNPPCCNPRHLLEGTQGDNVQDAIERGRHVPPPQFKGDAHPRARLTAERVRDARKAHAEGQSIASLARACGVGWTTMSHALAGRTWPNA